MFQCDQCGCCCRRIGEVDFAKHMALSNGTCKFLDTKTNLCTIYEKRPIFCRVDEFYEKFLSDRMTKENFYLQNKMVCQKFKSEREEATIHEK